MANRITYQFGDNGKLVRDGVHQSMIVLGQQPEAWVAEGPELARYARLKIDEELAELDRSDQKAEELADLLESVGLAASIDGFVEDDLQQIRQLIDDAAVNLGLTPEDIAAGQRAKFDRVGGFSGHIVVLRVTVTEGDEYDKYYSGYPDRFRRVEL